MAFDTPQPHVRRATEFRGSGIVNRMPLLACTIACNGRSLPISIRKSAISH